MCMAGECDQRDDTQTAAAGTLLSQTLDEKMTSHDRKLVVSTAMAADQQHPEEEAQKTPTGTGQLLNKHMLLVHTLSPGAESNHDSCYDSDTSPSRSRRNSSQHCDVSRTVSDTLAAELQDTDSSGSSGGGGSGGETQQKTEQQDQHVNRVKYALKLGYSEQQLSQALCKVGQNASENQLLSALITLGVDDDDNNDDIDEEEEPPQQAGCLPLTASPTKKHESLGQTSNNLRHIIIDGSNVAMSHGNKEVFSCRGIELAVEWFLQRGHENITVFVPIWRKEASRPDAPIQDQGILLELERRGIVVFTPARRIGGKRVVCYDDLYVMKHAVDTDGVVVSNDNYRDLLREGNPAYRKVIEERLLMYSFVQDKFMPPDDPLGRHGPSLDHFLQKEPVMTDPPPQLCPYAKKCTYGNKCKFYHPERGMQPQKSVTEKLQEQTNRRLREAKEKGLLTHTASLGDPYQQRRTGLSPKRALTTTRSVPTTSAPPRGKKALSRTKSVVPQPAISITEATEVMTQPPPGHWSLTPTTSILRPPPTSEEDDGTIVSGHLALAKKLSDEGSAAEDKGQSTAPVAPKRHQKLARQLSLRGSEDPRLQPHPVYNPNPQAADWFNNSPGLPRGLIAADSPSPPPPPPQQSHRPLVAKASLPLPPAHTPVGRMASAPVTQHNSLLTNHNSNSSSNIHGSGSGSQRPPLMSRQNSTSDPQIHVGSDQQLNMLGDPRWVFEGSVSSSGGHFGAGLPDVSQPPPPPPNSHYGYLQKIQQQHHHQQQQQQQHQHQQQQQFQQQQQQHKHMFQQQNQAHMESGHMHPRVQGLYQGGYPPSRVNPQQDQSQFMTHQMDPNRPSQTRMDPSRPQIDPSRHVPPMDMSRMPPPPTDQGVERSAFKPPVQNTSQSNIETRNGLFFHLCGLFPEEYVIKVMNEYPDERRAEKLCLYIMKLANKFES